MMILDDALVTNMLFMSTTLLLAAATVAILRFQRLAQRSAPPPENAGAVPRPAAAASESIEQRVRALQEVAEELARKEELLQCKERTTMPYENAVRMARCGAGVEELTRSCGLKKGEAELLVRLHSRPTGA
jgi:hypothetical protein